MKLNNFTFRSKSLTQKGYMRCYFNGASGFQVTQSPALTISTSKSPNNDRIKKIQTAFDTTINLTFQVCKNNCKNLNQPINESEKREFIKWLSGNKYEKITFDNGYYLNVIVTSIKDIIFGETIYGFEITISADTPYLLTDKIITFETNAINEKVTIPIDHDFQGYFYPTLLDITIKTNGDLKITNEFENRYTFISQCKVNEHITMDCENKIITTSLDITHALAQNFNFKYLRFISDLNVTSNTIMVSIPCKITIKMIEVRKDDLI